MPNIGSMLGIAYQTEVGRLSKALADSKTDITAAEYLIMRVLFSQDNIQQCEISKALCKDKASINRGIQSLVAKGYVSLTPVSYKCCIVSLTDKGKEVRPKLLEIATGLHQKLASKITHQQMDELRQILQSIIN